MTASKEDRRSRRLAKMARNSTDAQLIKIADTISNLRAIDTSPPAGWTPDRRLSYLRDCERLVGAARGTNARIENLFSQTASDIAKRLENAQSAQEFVQTLDASIGQDVYLLHIPNTAQEEITDQWFEDLYTLADEAFPSMAIQRWDAVYDGSRRETLVLRLRSDSSEAIVALAQRACRQFGQRFVGLETGQKYIRIYEDDTG